MIVLVAVTIEVGVTVFAFIITNAVTAAIRTIIVAAADDASGVTFKHAAF